ncbi:von Willebrand factor-like [Cebidichthys violaceus]|uniref:von Willebrand factor-like n=1 Tax=Cebidichthys violaceus TaxID=271503 RepID=UPI0035CB65F1
MKPLGSSGFKLEAGFRERRRKDVSFLDHLIITQSGVRMHLGQGGRVRVGDQTLNLNTTAQLLHGVELSKDQTGVTAKIPSSNMTVFFDGNTAHVSGPMQALEGLCGNPTNPSQTTSLDKEKNKESGCFVQHNDTVDGTINCNRSAEHCDLLRQPPFTACHNHTDPEPYVAACKDTLCKYPAVDGLNCQFMEAYAKSCSLKDDVTLADWRSTVGCSAVPKASCLDQYCSDHEFCGEKLGKRSCLCRALFASKYKPTNV